MFRIISFQIKRVIASYIFKNIDFWSMQKRRFLIFILKTFCRMKKFQIRKRCTTTRRAITCFLFRIFMHFDFLLIIGKVLSSSSVASPYSIRALNLAEAGSVNWNSLGFVNLLPITDTNGRLRSDWSRSYASGSFLKSKIQLHRNIAE